MIDGPRGEESAFDEARETLNARWISRLRSKPGAKQAYRLGVLVLGSAFIALGIALAVLPGPLTIPPILLGVWIWSKEFRFAERLFDSFQEKARDTWEHSKRRPKSAAASPLCGLAVAAAAFWAAGRYQVLDDVKGAVGL